MIAKKEALKADTMRVRAIVAGYIGDGPLGMIYRNPGDVFTLIPREIPLLDAAGKASLDANGKLKTRTLTAENQFSAVWMQVVDDDEPEVITTAQDEINKQVAELNSGGWQGKRRKKSETNSEAGQ